MSQDLTRRAFLCVVAGCAAAAAGGCGDVTHTDFFRRNLKEMSPEEIAEVVRRMEERVRERYGKQVLEDLGKDVRIGTRPALEGVEFAYALDIARCIGCRRCVYGCVEENNQSRDPQVHWIRVLEMDKARGIDFAHADAYYEAAEVPREGHFYLPVACQQCTNPPCVKTCPTEATWRTEDGIVVIDYEWCIGCRCCMAACPYGARHFNWTDPGLPAEDLNPTMHVLGNRPRTKGVVEKCTFCVHRVREGRYPRCVEVCPVGARKFGDILDPASEIRYILEHKRVFVLKAELNTRPRFFYYYG